MNQSTMPSHPRVTVIIPTYNREEFICETVDSILAQDYPEKEILVIDDGSRDNTAMVLRQYGNQIRYFHHENRGEAATVNRGWGLATGKYVAIVSSDDPVRPGWLSACVAFMEKSPPVLVGYPDWVMIDDGGKELNRVEVFEYSLERLLGWWHCLPGPGALIRRAALADLTELRNPNCRYISDMETWARLVLRGEFARIPGFWATWRYHSGATTVSASTVARAEETIAVAERLFAREDLPQQALSQRSMGLSRAYAQASRIVLGAAPLKSLAYYRRSLALCPTEPQGLPLDMQRRGFVRDALAGGWRRLARILRRVLRRPESAGG